MKTIIPILIICLAMTGCVSQGALVKADYDPDAFLSNLPQGTFDDFVLVTNVPHIGVLEIHAYPGQDGQIRTDVLLRVQTVVLTVEMTVKGLRGTREEVSSEIRSLVQQAREEVGKRMAK